MFQVGQGGPPKGMSQPKHPYIRRSIYIWPRKTCKLCSLYSISNSPSQTHPPGSRRVLTINKCTMPHITDHDNCRPYIRCLYCLWHTHQLNTFCKIEQLGEFFFRFMSIGDWSTPPLVCRTMPAVQPSRLTRLNILISGYAMAIRFCTGFMNMSRWPALETDPRDQLRSAL